MYLMQSDFGGILWFVMFFVIMLVYPRLMLSQMLYKLEASAKKLESMSVRANTMAAKKADTKPSRELKNEINEFTDFFVVEPSNIDPYGLVRKIDQTIRSMENRFSEFANKIAGRKDYKERQELNYSLRAAIGVRQIAKIVRHNVEMAKKFKNLQIAMILQMQLPIIEKIAEGELKGTEAFANGWPIGDSIGPLAAASFMKNSKEIADEVVMGETVIKGRKCFVLKAKGPAPHLGRIDEAINQIMKRNKVGRIITIDAAQKMEGEKTGSVAEGIGFAMGGIGQREMIENVLLPMKKPIDSVVIKVGMMEAIMPMKKEIYDSLPKVRALVERSVERAGRNEKLIIIGVGNSCGIRDDEKAVDELKPVIDKFDKLYKQEAEKEKGSWF